MYIQTTKAQFEKERLGFCEEITDLKTQLVSLQMKLQGTPSTDKKSPDTSEVCLNLVHVLLY